MSSSLYFVARAKRRYKSQIKKLKAELRTAQERENTTAIANARLTVRVGEIEKVYADVLGYIDDHDHNDEGDSLQWTAEDLRKMLAKDLPETKAGPAT